MNFLTPEQRARAIEMLSRAPDEVLLTAMVEFRKIRHMEEGMLNNVNQMIDDLTERRKGETPVAEERRWIKDEGVRLELVKSAPTKGEILGEALVNIALGQRACPAPEVVERPNVNPGAPNITKIGTKTKEEILDHLHRRNQPPSKFTEHLKLLWARGHVKFDGERYYL